MSYHSWHVGMKVVCVDGQTKLHRAPEETFPVEGCTYTIRAIAIDCYGQVGVRLDEIRNPPNKWRRPDTDGSQEVGFLASRFRPVHTRNTDISIFTAMLDGAKERERA